MFSKKSIPELLLLLGAIGLIALFFRDNLLGIIGINSKDFAHPSGKTPNNEACLILTTKESDEVCVPGLMSEPKDWQLSADKKVFAYLKPHANRYNDYQVYLVYLDGRQSRSVNQYVGQNSMGSFGLSPDGRYLSRFSGHVSYFVREVADIEKNVVVCSKGGSPGGGSPPLRLDCPPVRLNNGQWWSVTHDFVYQQKTIEIIEESAVAAQSPNQQWFVGMIKTETGTPLKEFVIINQDSSIEIRFPPPDKIYPDSYLFSLQIYWRPDSHGLAFDLGRSDPGYIYTFDPQKYEVQLRRKIISPKNWPNTIPWDEN